MKHIELYTVAKNEPSSQKGKKKLEICVWRTLLKVGWTEMKSIINVLNPIGGKGLC